MPATPTTIVATEAATVTSPSGFRAPASDAGSAAALDVVAAALARGPAGRLPRELVQNRQLARAVRTSVFQGRDGGCLVARRAARRGPLRGRCCASSSARCRALRTELSPGRARRARAAVEAELARGQETAAGYARAGAFATRARPTPVPRACARSRLEDVRIRTEPLVAASNVFARGRGAHGRARGPRGAAHRARRDRRAQARARSRDPRLSGQAGVVRAVLPSGVHVLVLRDAGAPSVAAHARLVGRAPHEDARSNGATSLLAATLTRGTRTRDAVRLAADLAAVGGTLAAVGRPRRARRLRDLPLAAMGGRPRAPRGLPAPPGVRRGRRSSARVARPSSACATTRTTPTSQPRGSTPRRCGPGIRTACRSSARRRRCRASRAGASPITSSATTARPTSRSPSWATSTPAASSRRWARSSRTRRPRSSRGAVPQPAPRADRRADGGLRARRTGSGARRRRATPACRCAIPSVAPPRCSSRSSVATRTCGDGRLSRELGGRRRSSTPRPGRASRAARSSSISPATPASVDDAVAVAARARSRASWRRPVLRRPRSTARAPRS